MSRPFEHQVIATDRIGAAEIASPLKRWGQRFVGPDQAVVLHAELSAIEAELDAGASPQAFEMAGPRATVHFEGMRCKAAIVTCGGLCPGINNVVRSVVLTLTHAYGVPDILGYRYGFAGLADAKAQPMVLSPAAVDGIHEHGGTLLGSSRGPQPVDVMVDRLLADGVDMLFVVGGDGSMQGAAAIADEVRRRSCGIAVVGVPKTIDNDLHWIERSFGFATAVEEATRTCSAAHAESRGAPDGVAVVKLMGRHAGFIAAHATLASSDVNFCLVPEVHFDLDGPGGFLSVLDDRLALRHHAVVVVAEGAAQELVADLAHGADPSGNRKLGDIGRLVAERITAHLGAGSQVRYLDPSYSIRSLKANALDAEYCLALGQHAVHAAMSGRTRLMIGFWNQHFTHVPLSMATGGRQLDPQGDVWQRVIETTGQPIAMRAVSRP